MWKIVTHFPYISTYLSYLIRRPTSLCIHCKTEPVFLSDQAVLRACAVLRNCQSSIFTKPCDLVVVLAPPYRGSTFAHVHKTWRLFEFLVRLPSELVLLTWGPSGLPIVKHYSKQPTATLKIQHSRCLPAESTRSIYIYRSIYWLPLCWAL